MKVKTYMPAVRLLSVALSVFALQAISAFADDTYDGWTGTLTTYKCTDAECNSSDGCSFGGGQHDQYWAQFRCASTGNEGDICTQSYHLCRETKFYPNNDCSTGIVNRTTDNYYGACLSTN